MRFKWVYLRPRAVGVMSKPTTRNTLEKLIIGLSLLVAMVIYMTLSNSKHLSSDPPLLKKHYQEKETNEAHSVSYTDQVRDSDNNGTTQISPEATKTILMMYHPDKFKPEQIKKIFNECPDVKCEFTHDEKAITKSAAVIFHYVGKHVYSMPKRQPGQLWLYYNLERPTLMKDELARYMTDKRMFNGTVNYYPSSLAWFPYGKYNGTHIWTYNKIHNTFLNTTVNFAAKKNKLLFWAVSNCYAESKRQDYVKELQKYVKVDIYGGCGPLSCPRSRDCDNTVFKSYKFYLALENKVCQDYITEKLWLTLATRETVPIVLGGANHEKYLPPKSYIDIRDFATPADLANYLQKLDKDNDLYNEYFSWRYKTLPVFDFQKATPKQPLLHYLCQVCSLTHTANLNKTFVDFVDINNDKTYCLHANEYYKGKLPGY
ncbi:unnamed protein product [Owenia fusiformis]|uniref:Fucosyltransferase n=1 Tax=Owenia fusiformis TaxID=6347 RepID=A0A8J1TE10_OWEFU|nr:unnamed protein product [Owenia fusiformis]